MSGREGNGGHEYGTSVTTQTMKERDRKADGKMGEQRLSILSRWKYFQ